MRRIMVGILVLMVMGVLGTGRVGAACTGVTKCGIQDPISHNCPTDDYTTENCTPVGDACYAFDCGGNTGCDKGDTCDTAGGGGTLLCADATQPSCSLGACTGGKVCVSTGATECGCSNGASCDDYVKNPKDLVVTRISPTTARIQWSAPTIYQYVDQQRLAVSDVMTDAIFCSVTGATRANCVVNELDLAPTVSSYDATGKLTPGTHYYVVLTFVAGAAPGAFSNCTAFDQITYLSSCELTPNPTTVAVGGTRTLTTDLAAQFYWSVAYSRMPTAYATVTTPDATLPFMTTVTGVANGITTVTNRVTNTVTGVEMCNDIAEVAVGCVTAAPVAPTLVAPSNGATLSTVDVTLDWNGTTDWGSGCPSNNNTYRVYLNESSPPTTQIASVGSGTIASNFTGEFGKTYYWRVGAHNGSLESLSSIRSFTIQSGAAQNAWWQVEGAGVYAGSSLGGVTIGSQVPSGNYLIIPGSVGSVAALMRASGTPDTGDGGISTSAWNALTQYRGKRVDYAYLAAQMGVTYTQANDFATDALDKPAYDSTKEFYFIEPSTGEAHLSSAWSVESGEKYVVFVDGDLRIDQNVTVANGGFLLWVVSGDIIIDPTVSEVEGLMVASGRWVSESTGATDTQLTVAGSVVGWGGIELNRDLGGAANASPAERFVYRSDLLITMPDPVKTFVMQWAEVAPGTFGN